MRSSYKKKPYGTAYDRGLYLLAMRDHSRLELRRKLIQKGFEKSEVDQALEKLIEQKYLSDSRYSEVKARSLIRKGFGDRYINQKLGSQGLRGHSVKLKEQRTDLDLGEEEALLKFLTKKKQRDSHFSPSMEVQKKYQASALRKGYSNSLFIKVWKLLLEDSSSS